MHDIIRRLGSLAAGLVHRHDPAPADPILDGGNPESPIPTDDRDAATRVGSRIDRVRFQRADVTAALRADAGTPERELTAWPPVRSHGRFCRAA